MLVGALSLVRNDFGKLSGIIETGESAAFVHTYEATLVDVDSTTLVGMYVTPFTEVVCISWLIV